VRHVGAGNQKHKSYQTKQYERRLPDGPGELALQRNQLGPLFTHHGRMFALGLEHRIGAGKRQAVPQTPDRLGVEYSRFRQVLIVEQGWSPHRRLAGKIERGRRHSDYGSRVPFK